MAGRPATALTESGYALVRTALPAADVDGALRNLGGEPLGRAGTRNLLEAVWCRAIALALASHPEIGGELECGAVAVQCTCFDKTEDSNWGVGLHQDLSVPVRDCVPGAGLGGWTRKEGGWYVQAPDGLLRRMLAVRLHLDECGTGNGPLLVVPGSHLGGRLEPASAREVRATRGEHVCTASAGDALLMRPLLLHASRKATAPGHRRVLHFLFGPADPGRGLAWPSSVLPTFEAVPRPATFGAKAGTALPRL